MVTEGGGDAEEEEAIPLFTLNRAQHPDRIVVVIDIPGQQGSVDAGTDDQRLTRRPGSCLPFRPLHWVQHYLAAFLAAQDRVVKVESMPFAPFTHRNSRCRCRASLP
jgi:hypothetical protein